MTLLRRIEVEPSAYRILHHGGRMPGAPAIYPSFEGVLGNFGALTRFPLAAIGRLSQCSPDQIMGGRRERYITS